MKSMLKSAREAKGLKTVDLARLAGLDKALISKFESGDRMPTLDQLKKLSGLLSIDFESLHLKWLTLKILAVSGQDAIGKKALESALQELSGSAANEVPTEKLLQELEVLKNMILKNK